MKALNTLILSMPALFMCGGVIWMLFSTLLAGQKTGRVDVLRRMFGSMSIVIGGMFVVWAVIVMLSDIVKIAYPIVIMCVGLLLVLQGWAFRKFKLF